MAGRDKDIANVPAKLKRAVDGLPANLSRAVKQAAKRSK